MWQGLFQPLLHDRALDGLSAAARNSALDDHYAVLARARRWSPLFFCQIAAQSYARHTSPPEPAQSRPHAFTRPTYSKGVVG